MRLPKVGEYVHISTLTRNCVVLIKNIYNVDSSCWIKDFAFNPYNDDVFRKYKIEFIIDNKISKKYINLYDEDIDCGKIMNEKELNQWLIEQL
jgi:hypothetical protein